MSRNWMLAMLGVLAVFPLVFGADISSLKRERDQISEQIKAKHKQLDELRHEASKSDSIAKLQAEASAAHKALMAKEQADAGVQAARKKLDEANKARDAVVKAELAANPEGSKLLKQIDAEEAKIRAAVDEINKLRGRLHQVRETLAKSKGGRVEAADASTRKVHDELQAVTAKVATTERAAHDKARAAVDTKLNESFNQNPKVVELKKSIDSLRARDFTISKELHDLEHPKPKATEKPKGEDKPKEEGKRKEEAKPKHEKPKEGQKPKEEAKPKK